MSELRDEATDASRTGKGVKSRKEDFGNMIESSLFLDDPATRDRNPGGRPPPRLNPR